MKIKPFSTFLKQSFFCVFCHQGGSGSCINEDHRWCDVEGRTGGEGDQVQWPHPHPAPGQPRVLPRRFCGWQTTWVDFIVCTAFCCFLYWWSAVIIFLYVNLFWLYVGQRLKWFQACLWNSLIPSRDAPAWKFSPIFLGFVCYAYLRSFFISYFIPPVTLGTPKINSLYLLILHHIFSFYFTSNWSECSVKAAPVQAGMSNSFSFLASLMSSKSLNVNKTTHYETVKMLQLSLRSMSTSEK